MTNLRRFVGCWLGIGGIGAFCCLAAQTPEPLFPVSFLPVEDALLSSIVSADVDGDGHEDVVTAHPSGMAVLLGNGDGSFRDEIVIETLAAKHPVAADFNGDGVMDLAAFVSPPGPDDNVVVLLGNGDLTFRSLATIPLGLWLLDLSSGDFDADGHSDLAVVVNDGTFTTGEMVILLGLGDGTFRPPVRFDVTTPPRAVAVRDLNQDRIQDLAVAEDHSWQCDATSCHRIPGGVSLHLGIGDGTFLTSARVEADDAYDAYTDITIGDLNRDGVEDVAVSRNRSGFGVLLGDGDGGFGPEVVYGAGAWCSAIVIDDFDLDGNPDVAVAAADSDDVSIRLGNGDGTFEEERRFVAGQHANAVITTDFNEDGHPDLLVGAASNDGTLLLGRGDGTFPSVDRVEIDDAPRFLRLVDLNEDGMLDFVVGNAGPFAPRNAAAFLGTGGGSYERSCHLPIELYLDALEVADVDGDGAEDLVVSESGSFGGSVNVFAGTGTGCFEPIDRLDAGGSVESMTMADFDADGVLDLALVVSVCPALLCTVDREVMLHMGSGDGTFGAGQALELDREPRLIASSDLDGDGREDLIIDTDTDLSILTGQGDGTFGPPRHFEAGGYGVKGMVLEDIDGDGAVDLAISRRRTLGSEDPAGVVILWGTGDAGFDTSITVAPVDWPGRLIAGDLNADGLTDVALVTTPGNLAVVLGSGYRRFAGVQEFASGGMVVDLAAGDLDGDHRQDLMTAYTTDFSRRLIPVAWRTLDYNGVTVHRNQGPFPTIPVPLDVNPGNPFVPIKTGSSGVTAAAVLGTTELDASSLDPATLRLAGAPVKIPGASGRELCREKDVDHDGLVDLTCNFVTKEMSLTSGESLLVLEGTTFAGIPVRGEETVRVLP